MDRGRVSPASEAVLPLSLEQQQQDHFDTNDDRYKDILYNILNTRFNRTIKRITLLIFCLRISMFIQNNSFGNICQLRNILLNASREKMFHI